MRGPRGVHVKKTIGCVAVVVLMLFVGVRPAAAQTAAAQDKWTFVVTPYLLGASLGGTVTLKGREADVDLPVSTVLKHLEAGFMAVGVARKGNWGVGADVFFASLGASKSIATVGVDEGLYSFYGLRRLGSAADLTFGARVYHLKGTLDLSGPLGFSGAQTVTWADPIVGLLLHTPDGRRVVLQVYSEVGGFGAGSDITWQVVPTVDIKLAKWISLDFGYRWMDVDYAKGDGTDRFAWNVLTQGGFMGFSFKF